MIASCVSNHEWAWFEDNAEKPRSDIEYWQGPVIAALACQHCESRGLIWAQAGGGENLSKRVYHLATCPGSVFDRFLKNQAHGSCQVSRAHEELLALFQLGSDDSAFYLIDLTEHTAQLVEAPSRARVQFDSWQSGFDQQFVWQSVIDQTN